MAVGPPGTSHSRAAALLGLIDQFPQCQFESKVLEWRSAQRSESTPHLVQTTADRRSCSLQSCTRFRLIESLLSRSCFDLHSRCAKCVRKRIVQFTRHAVALTADRQILHHHSLPRQIGICTHKRTLLRVLHADQMRRQAPHQSENKSSPPRAGRRFVRRAWSEGRAERTDQAHFAGRRHDDAGGVICRNRRNRRNRIGQAANRVHYDFGYPLRPVYFSSRNILFLLTKGKGIARFVGNIDLGPSRYGI